VGDQEAMSEAGHNLTLILAAWTSMVRSRSTRELERILDEKVTWQGVLPQLVCTSREDVLDVLVRNRPWVPRFTRVEAEERGERVAVSVEGPDFPDTGLHAASAARSLVFTFQDGKVVRMESFRSRDQAFEALVP
jgi:hypothetical protein